MTCFKPATPGFVVTLVATGLLAAVSFGVPWIKSIYFLKATVQGFDGSLTFGTLGYCLQQSSDTTCSKASVGYEIDINTLLGNETIIQVPNVVVKWITYCLVLHLVALVLAAISAVFGLLAHVSEFAGTCCSTCVAGFSAAVAFLAFVFDLALFFLTKSRINEEKGGTAVMGNAIWLTLAAWILLFLSGFFYCCGSCCIRNRPSRNRNNRGFEEGQGQYPDQMRLDAVKAEADRKARQKLATEVGLPAFHEYQPLNRKMSADEEYYEDGDHVVRTVGNIGQNTGIGAGTSAYDRHGAGGQFTGGYVQAPAGTRAVDEYYSPTRQASNSQYPPQPQRQSSQHTLGASTYSAYSTASSPALPVHQLQNQYLSTGSRLSASGTSSYQSATSHQQYPTNYSQYPDASAAGYNPYATPAATPSNHYNQPNVEPERSYTLGGGGYGSYVVPEPQHDTSYSHTQQTSSPPLLQSPHLPGPVQTEFSGALVNPHETGAHLVQSPVVHYEDSPPTYDEGIARGPSAWSNTA